MLKSNTKKNLVEIYSRITKYLWRMINKKSDRKKNWKMFWNKYWVI